MDYHIVQLVLFTNGVFVSKHFKLLFYQYATPMGFRLLSGFGFYYDFTPKGV